jgi:hypothetical protein
MELSLKGRWEDKVVNIAEWPIITEGVGQAVGGVLA